MLKFNIIPIIPLCSKGNTKVNINYTFTQTLFIFFLYFCIQNHIYGDFTTQTIRISMTLGEKIKLVRSQKKMSQADLANGAGVHQKNISKYENDGVVPSALTLKALAKSLNVTTDYLLGGTDDDIIKDTELLNSFKEIDKMPDKFKSALMDVIQAYVRDYRTRQAYAQ